MSGFPIEDALKPECDSIRADLLAIEKRAREIVAKQEEATDDGANERYISAQLAVRHIEDARMRIGKVLQYSRDGISCFDHTKETP